MLSQDPRLPIRFEYFMEGDPNRWFGRLYFHTEEARDDALSAFIRAARDHYKPADADKIIARITAHYRRSKFATIAVTGLSVQNAYVTATMHDVDVQAYEQLPEDRE